MYRKRIANVVFALFCSALMSFGFSAAFVGGVVRAENARVTNPENGHQYQLVNTPAFWEDAVAISASMGGHLVTINSAAENSFVYNMYPYTWLGATEAGEGNWYWVTGEPFTYTNWAPGEPTNCCPPEFCGGTGCTPESYLNYFGGLGGQWNDVPNGQGAFIVEWDNPLNITSPTEGQQFDRHEAVLEQHNISFAWEGPNDAQYSVSLYDKNTSKYLKDAYAMGTATSFDLSDQQLAYGHEYEFTVKDELADGSTNEAKVTFKVKVLPDITEPLALRMDQATTPDGRVIWEGVNPDLLLAKAKFDAALAQKHWRAVYTSAYRPIYYQEHLYLIRHNLADKNLSSTDKRLLQDQASSHQLRKTVAPPNPTAPHVSGVAFDASVFDSKNKQLNKNSADPELQVVANDAGLNILAEPSKDDFVHFQLQ